jgi:hypothetical protein
MSTKFFLAPYERLEWEANEHVLNELVDIFRVTPEEYKRNILLRWPQAHIYPSPILPFTCELPSPRAELSGLRVSLMPNLQVVSFEAGPIASFCEFILWHRSIVPKAHRLFLFNSASPASLEIRVDSTEQEIIEFTSIED